jgi:hypothetical protein
MTKPAPICVSYWPAYGNCSGPRIRDAAARRKYATAWLNKNRAYVNAKNRIRRAGPEGDQIRAAERKRVLRHRKRYPDLLLSRTRRYKRKHLGIPEPTRPAPPRCECCSWPVELCTHKRLNVDHDHITGAFRGWLCNGCNLSIGRLGDTVEDIQKAVEYLRRTQFEHSLVRRKHQ